METVLARLAWPGQFFVRARKAIDFDAALGLLFPELLLQGTPWLAIWREGETRSVVRSSRIALLAAAVALVLHHFLVDVPLGLEPRWQWATYRFGSAAGYLLLFALTFLRFTSTGMPARLPLLILTLAVSTLQAKTVQWLPSVPYFYAFALTFIGAVLLRRSVLETLAVVALCFICQWQIAWRYCDLPPAKLASAALITCALAILLRGRMAADVLAFAARQRQIDAQRQLIEEQMELDTAKNNFFATVSHELRTPLTLILAPLESLRSTQEGLPPSARGDLEIAERNAKRLLADVNALLDLSRLDARHDYLRLETVDVVGLVRSLLEMARPLAIKKHLMIELAVVEPVLPFAIDRDKVEKMVLNLIANAIRFTDGSPQAPGRVTLTCGVRGNRFYCAVEDTGIGMSEAELARVFRRYQQASHGRGGSGIGLVLVKELAVFHSGDVTATSQPRKGSCFTLELPLDASVHPIERLDRRATQTEVIADRRQPPVPRDAHVTPLSALAPLSHLATSDAAARLPSGCVGRPLVLLVDDNPEMLDYLSRQLTGDYRVITAERAADALAIAKAESPAIIVSDVRMPGHSGVDLLRDLRRHESTCRVPVIFVTARADTESKVDTLEQGADEYLIKPFSLAELRVRMRYLLLQRRLEQELAEKNERLAQVNFGLVFAKRQVFLDMIEAFAFAIEAKDPSTHGHSRRVAILAESMCSALHLSAEEREEMRVAGTLHDIGKIGIPESVLGKQGKLTAEESASFKSHSRLGYSIISAISELESTGRVVLHHHERFDGNGYPDGLTGEQIPLLARILAVCDTYDAMTSNRPYRKGMSHKTAVEEIARCSGTQFDPACARAFLRLYREAPPAFPTFPSIVAGKEQAMTAAVAV